MIIDFIKYVLSKIGYEIRKVHVGDYRESMLSPIENLFIHKKDKFLFSIPVEKCRTQLWHNLSIKSNPFVRTLVEFRSGNHTKYEGSQIAKYYASFKPSDAGEFLKTIDNENLKRIRPYGYFLPWEMNSEEEILRIRERVARQENKVAGRNLTLSAGHTDFGPVTKEKGEIEFDRLVKVFNSIKKNGYREKVYSDNTITGYFLKNDEDWCFIITGGKHRAYALSALGYKEIPVVINSRVGAVVDTHNPKLWKHVESKKFSNEEALTLADKIINLKL